ncbi:MAG TPA: biopolymer transporter ExbD [bacterium]|nr:biopolymer transporter ExbD [bacterium]
MGAVDVAAPSGGKQKKGLRRPKRRIGIRIDMTPMVDIAFLLLIFYMVSTIFAEPQAMEINLPPKEAEETEIKTKQSELLTLRVSRIGDEDRIFWSMGTEKPDTVSLAGLPQLLQSKVREIPGLITVVKIHKDAKYNSMVGVLDRIELVEYRFREAQKLAKERGQLPPDEKEFSYKFSMAPWTRLDTKMIAEVTGQTAPEEGS